MNRADAEAQILVMLAAYRHADSYTNEQIAEFISAQLSLGGLFKPPKAVPSADALAAAAATPDGPATRMTFRDLRIEAWADNDEDYGVDLICEACSNILGSIDSWYLSDILATAEGHNKDHH